jgi:hypothetical protein
MTRDRNLDDDAFSRFQPRERGRFGENEFADDSPTKAARSNLVDLDLILYNDNPAKKAIAVSLKGGAPFEAWVWLPRSKIEYEKRPRGMVHVALPENLAKEKGLI